MAYLGIDLMLARLWKLRVPVVAQGNPKHAYFSFNGFACFELQPQNLGKKPKTSTS